MDKSISGPYGFHLYSLVSLFHPVSELIGNGDDDFKICMKIRI